MIFLIGVVCLILGIVFLLIKRSKSWRVEGEYIEAKRIKINILGWLFLIIGIILMLGSSILFVGSTEVKVLKYLTGQVIPHPYKPGVYVVNPFTISYTYSTRLQEYTMSSAREEGKRRGDDAIGLLCKDGLYVKADVTVWWKVLPDSAVALFLKIGDFSNLEEKFVRPAIRSVLRDIATSYTAMDLTQKKFREEFSKRVKDKLNDILSGKGVVVEEVLLRDIKLPEQVKKAIEEKIVAIQEAERMKYILEKEKLEADRKRVEAQGIRDANKIIATSLTREYISWYYVDMLKQLIKSPNNTIIIVPMDYRGLTPFILTPSGKK